MNKKEYREQLANLFVNALEEKGLNWKKGWHGVGKSPFNGVSKAKYKGCNAFMLRLISMAKGYDDPRWLTMLQIMDKNGRYHKGEKWHLKAGSKAAYVEYWCPYDTVNKKTLTWEQYKDALESGRNQNDFTLHSKYTPVFNACDIEGISALDIPMNPDVSQDELIRKISDGMDVEIFTDGGDEAYYLLFKDEIHLPKPEYFENEYAFNATALHELSHSTGHASRLNRHMSADFGSEEYAYEELVAEMCSCFMGTELQKEATPQHIENHKAYVQGWVHRIKEKPDALVKAIKDAQEAAEYMELKAGLVSGKDSIEIA